MQGDEALSGNSCNHEILKEFSDVGGNAIFLASSTREGSGLENVRDDNRKTYWQSNGSLPHYIDVIFPKFTKINSVYIYTSSTDESYTPRSFRLQVGTDFHDLQTVSFRETSAFYYWQILPVAPHNSFIEVMMLRIIILSNHFNGIDSKIHQLLVLGPKETNNIDLAYADISQLSSLPSDFSKPPR